MALTNCGKVFSWGKGDRDLRVNMDDYYEPKNVFDLKRYRALDLYFVSISSGASHSAAVTSLGGLYMWGESTSGSLGRPPPDGSTKSKCFMPLAVDFFSDKQVLHVACGELFTIVTTVDKRDLAYLSIIR